MSANDLEPQQSEPTCDVNWGSHACVQPADHDGFCHCDCGEPDENGEINPVGVFPYYGPDTMFWGADVAAMWELPVGDDGAALLPLSASPRYLSPGRNRPTAESDADEREGSP